MDFPRVAELTLAGPMSSPIAHGKVGLFKESGKGSKRIQNHLVGALAGRDKNFCNLDNMFTPNLLLVIFFKIFKCFDGLDQMD